jgi:nicotinamide mononucleotide transporter
MIEVLAVIFTLLCVWLTTKRHILSWPIGILAVIFYAIVFWNAKLYSDFGLQFFFFGQSIVGWITWKNHLEDKSHTKIEALTTWQKWYWFMIGLWAYGVLAFTMKNYTNASVPWADSLVAVGSLIANWLLAKRKFESWYIWIGVDAICVGLFLYKGLFWSAGLYGILLFLAIKGLKDWKKCLAA